MSISVTTRSRTGLYLSYRDSNTSRFRYDRDDDEEQRLITPDLPPSWVDISDQVHSILADTQSKVQALERLHAKHVLPGFSDRSQEEQEIETATSDITKDFRKCQALIQRIAPANSHKFPPSSSQSQSDAQAAKNVQRALAAKVQDLSATFRKKQRVYMEKLQGHAIKNQDLLVASGTISLKGSAGMSAANDDVQAAAHTQSQSLMHANSTIDVDLQARDRELTEIAKSIAQLAELFKDLSVLVIDQGTLLDSVEYNIEQTASQMQEAVNELNTATRYQKNTGRRKCIFLLILIIIGLIIVIIYKPRRHSQPPPSSPPPSSDSDPTSTMSAALEAGHSFRKLSPKWTPRTALFFLPYDT